ncbi:MAG: winged helix-turn-helix domain-containing protein [Pseudomonadota bacterium]
MVKTNAAPPSRWRIGVYRFDADTKRLSGESTVTVLEPKAAALLAYFCQNAGRDIGRDELLATVWYGQIVTDNSISRAVVLLRKAFQDEAKVRHTIVTLPKFGYRLVANVAPLDTPTADDDPTQASRAIGSLPIAAGLIGLALLGLTLWLRGPEPTVGAPATTAIAPLSRLAIAQTNADLAPDGNALIYTARGASHSEIHWVEGPGAGPVPISTPEGNADFATWSHAGDFVVYQYMTDERCEFHRLSRAAFATRRAEVIYECVPGSYTELSLSPDDTTLYFVERPTVHAPYSVYALSLGEPSKRRLSQPVARGYGNHFVDVHPATGQLLVLGDHLPGKTSVYELDPLSDSFTLRRAFDYGLDSAIWSHRDDTIVHPSRHPSYQLVSSSLAGDDSRVIVSDSRRIASPRRVRAATAAAGDYLFTSYLYNRDIAVSAHSDDDINSAVMDYLPALSHAGDRLAFISKRSGESQIWIKNYATGALRSIESPDQGRRFHDLVWSADDQQLLANTNTGLLVYSLVTNEFTHRISLPLPAYAVSWVNADSVAVSHYESGRWRAYHYRLGAGETVALDERWAASVTAAGRTLTLDQSLAVYDGERQVAALADCAPLLWRYQLRFRIDHDTVVCHADDAPNDLLVVHADDSVRRLQNAVGRYEFFSMRGGVLAATEVTSAYSDIMRTQHSNL